MTEHRVYSGFAGCTRSQKEGSEESLNAVSDAECVRAYQNIPLAGLSYRLTQSSPGQLAM